MRACLNAIAILFVAVGHVAAPLVKPAAAQRICLRKLRSRVNTQCVRWTARGVLAQQVNMLKVWLADTPHGQGRLAAGSSRHHKMSNHGRQREDGLRPWLDAGPDQSRQACSRTCWQACGDGPGPP